MQQTPTPRQILNTLLPHLRVAAAYARQIQPQIAARPIKEQQENMFAAALSDADLSIQTLVEVALIGSFPNIRFFGEEYEQSYNTKYFRAIDLGEQGDYLVTLDPIDGTQFYLDGHDNYQIILAILNADEFEAVLAISPAQDIYYYALRGEGAWQGKLEDPLEACRPLQIGETQPAILLGWGMEAIAPALKDQYQIFDIATGYSHEVQIPNLNGMFSGELAGAIIRTGKWIDGAALAFLAQSAGCIVTTLEGNPPPPLHSSTDYQRPGFIVAASNSIHQDLVKAVQVTNSTLMQP
ncbi:inositol monophosphatase family protein [Geitlerinema calcuttense]|uniref:Inositol monophosphatase family protein n=1 Tax=Geitlerinema calcuttense NRMC-F 0142 TaxID=2922238 RepID=A0ABT7LZA9_9CYAN|nr:inositol monophosphatase family protein [Geitlerinema calcuttense]MDL5057354.1 inositol monophosphatase family protein [Geitlerinema calcuttense NRMC-F 0142]